MGIIFGRTANRRGGLGLQGGSRIFFLMGSYRGQSTRTWNSSSTVLEARLWRQWMHHPLSLGPIGVSYLPRSMYRLWQLILNFVRLLRVSASFTEER